MSRVMRFLLILDFGEETEEEGVQCTGAKDMGITQKNLTFHIKFKRFKIIGYWDKEKTVFCYV